jgi:hypothetical protein
MPMKSFLTMSILAATLAAPSVARPDDKTDCIAGFEAGQKLRHSGKLTAALTELARCTRDVCPRSLQTACVEQATEAVHLLPSVVLSATDRAHDDVAGVRVTVDGVVIATSLDGKPVAVDPGPHTFRFEAPGAMVAERQVVVNAGQKGQLVAAELAPTATPSSDAASRGDSTQRWLGIGAAALGVVGIGVGSALGVVAFDDWSQAKSECSSSGQCGAGSLANGSKSSGETAAVGSTAAFIAGGVLVAGGAVLFLTARGSPVATALAPSVGGAQIVGSF